jgi:hypothetical protein
MVGQLVDITDEADETIVAQASTVFQPESTDGTIDVDFGEVTLEAGHKYVVYEYLYTGEIPDQEENDKNHELPKDETPTEEHKDKHDKSQTFVVTTPETVDIPVEKKWADGASGEEAVIVLVKNGKETEKTLTLTEKNSWKGSFDNLPKYDEDGNEIEYTVDEETSNYDYEVESDGNGGYVVTNSPSSETVEVPVEKKWADGASGEEAVIVLVKNGEETDQTLTLTEENSWKGSFTNLPKYDGTGTENSYTVTEKTSTYLSTRSSPTARADTS